MSDRTRLRKEDSVFVLGERTYALLRVGDCLVAADVVFDSGVYYRLSGRSAISPESINGVVCQQEYFAAARLRGFVEEPARLCAARETRARRGGASGRFRTT